MKKSVWAGIGLAAMLAAATVSADDTGVQIIGGPDLEAETEAVSLDDMKIGVKAAVEGWGEITLNSYEQKDYIYGFGTTADIRSGEDADLAILQTDILNTQIKEKDYMVNAEVKVVYDDVYEYKGWVRQQDYDRSKDDYIHPEAQFAIGPMYTGHYYFGCTLPNAVFESEKPLSMIITIDGNEFVYNIRK